jgi:phosphoglycolate phosphatase-like HAD superfamily hydrolase
MPAGNTLRETKAMSVGALRATFLDADGVLLDSLPQHLAICADKARQYGLPLRIPDVDGFRRMVAAGIKVSPMLEFFRAVGFPDDAAKKAAADYEREFAQRYRPAAFAGIDAMLARLRRSGQSLGLVTANTAANVEPALGRALRHFDPRCLFYVDSSVPAHDKAWCLDEGARILGIAPGDCMFVGDQPADAKAACAAGCRFLGVTYGWGLTGHDPSTQTVDSVEAIADVLVGMAPASG